MALTHAARPPVYRFATRIAHPIVRQTRPLVGRYASTGSRPHLDRRHHPRGSTAVLALGLFASLALATGTAIALDEQPSADCLSILDADALAQTTVHLRSRSLSSLLRCYVVYSFTSSPTLVDVSSKLVTALERLRSLPLGIGELPWYAVRAITRETFFKLFAGGETAEGCMPLVDELATRGCASLLNYSVEADETKRLDANAPLLVKDVNEQILSAVNVAGSYTQRTASVANLKPTIVAVKLTGMIADAGALERASSAIVSSSEHQRGERLTSSLFPLSPELSNRDEQALELLYDSLRQICGQARRLGVRVDIDAEQSWFQPAIDSLWARLASEFNRPENPRSKSVPPIVFNSMQCYRKDAMERLEADMAFARQSGFSYGVKLVRGAYVEAENARAIKRKSESPIWPDKSSTDRCFDRCAALMTDAVATEVRDPRQDRQTAVLYASHNADSARKVVEQFRRLGLMTDRGSCLAVDDKLRGRIVFGQLLGMSDALTAALLAIFSPHSDTELDLPPLVLKYVPYAEIDDVLPYLVRRAQENKSVLHGRSGAKTERRLIGRELRRRMGFGGDTKL